ncbi:MAG: hypothetical protein QOD39_408, partial [Mycobacterium sp.]|nr:hypothetical protein [Mycobacterium sp.]
VDTDTDSGTSDSDVSAAADSDTFSINQNSDSDLPNTGGPSGILVPIGLLMTTCGYMLLRGRTRIANHRA